jgi:isopenicillin N synthase-like dioxygenase
MRQSDNLMVSRIDLPRLPVIDLSLFDLGDPWRDQVGAQIDSALSRFGFFYVVGHGIDAAVVDPLLEAGRRFFAAEEAVKSRARMGQDEHVPHGYVPLAHTLTAGSCDHKEALYFLAPLAPQREPDSSRPAVRGPILLPELPGFREPVVDYMRSLSGLGHKLMSMIARGLLLEDSYFVDRCTGSPATSFRMDNYPQVADTEVASETRDGAHSDQGLLTLLKQDGTGGGLELKFEDRWVEAADIPNSFVCTVGETLARLTNGRYVPTSHRVRNSTHGHRLVMPFCFDPSRDAVLEPIACVRASAPGASENDGMSSARSDPARRHLA